MNVIKMCAFYLVTTDHFCNQCKRYLKKNWWWMASIADWCRQKASHLKMTPKQETYTSVKQGIDDRWNTRFKIPEWQLQFWIGPELTLTARLTAYLSYSSRSTVYTLTYLHERLYIIVIISSWHQLSGSDGYENTTSIVLSRIVNSFTPLSVSPSDVTSSKWCYILVYKNWVYIQQQDNPAEWAFIEAPQIALSPI